MPRLAAAPPSRPRPEPRRRLGRAVLAVCVAGWMGLLAGGTAGAAPAEVPAATAERLEAGTLPAAPFHPAVAPSLSQARQALRGGGWPLRDANTGAGRNLLADPAAQVLHPFSLLLYPAPSSLWLPLLVLLRVAAGVGLASALLRRHGAGPAAALAGAAVHGAVTAALAPHPAGTFAALAPGLLLAAGELVRWPGKGSAAAVAAAALGLGSSADPAAVAVGLTATFAFGMAAVRPLAPAQRRHRLSRWAGWTGLGLLAAAPALWPALLAWRFRHAVSRFLERRADGLLRDPLNLQRGFGFGELWAPPGPGFWRPGAGWVMLAIVLVAGLVLLARRRWVRGGGFFAGLAVVGLVEVVRPPGVASVLEYLLLPAGAAWEGAYGTPWVGLAVAWWVAAALRPLLSPPEPETGPDETTTIASGDAAGRETARARLAWRLAVGALAVGLAAMGLAAEGVWRAGEGSRGDAAIPGKAPGAIPGEALELLHQVQAERGYGRVAAIGDAMAVGTAARAGVADPRGWLPGLPAGYVEAILPLLGEPTETAGRFGAVSHPLYDLLGVRWLVTPADLPGAPPGRLEGRFGDAAVWERGSALPLLFVPRSVRTAPPTEGWRRWLYDHADFRALSLVQPPSAATAAGESPAAGTGDGSAGDAVGGPMPTGGMEVVAETIHPARITARTVSARTVPARTEVSTAAGDVSPLSGRAPSTRRLPVATSLFQDGGWRGVVDGRTVPVGLSNGPFAALWVPSDARRVDLLYRPPGFPAGLLLAAVSLALGTTFLVSPPRPRKADKGLPGADAEADRQTAGTGPAADGEPTRPHRAAAGATSRRLRFVALHLGLVSVLLGGFAWRLRTFSIDDFFITFRYALHLAEGQGFRFNPDDTVFGTTAPGFGLLLAALRAVSGAPLPLLGALVTFASLALVCGLVLWDASAQRRPEGVLAAWLVASSTFLWVHVGGEMITVGALLMLAGHLAERGLPDRRPGPRPQRPGGRSAGIASGLLAGFAICCRPDSALGVAALGSWLWLRGRRIPHRFGWPAAAILATGLLAGRAWFGRFLPETLEAKRLQTRWMPEAWPGGGDFWPALLETAAGFTPVVPLAVLGLAGAVVAFRRGGGATRALLLWAAATGVAYPLLGVAMYAWYGIPALMAASVGAAYAAGAAGRALLRYLEGCDAPSAGGRSTGARVTAVLLATFLVLPVGFRTLLHGVATVVNPVQAPRLDLYRRAGTWIAENTPQDARVAAIEVGTLGFYGRRHIYDLLGLVSPEALPHVAAQDLVASFRAGNADYFVHYSPLAPLLDRVRESPGFAEEWSEAVRFETVETGPWLAIYRRDPP